MYQAPISKHVWNLNIGFLNLFGIWLLVLGAFAALPSAANAATYYWVGSDGGNTNEAANWATSNPASCTGGGAGTPGTNDNAIFDPDCDNSASINANFAASTLTMQSGYAGTVTQASGVTITLSGSGDSFVIAGGTFAGGDAVIDMNGGSFNQTGGSFTNSSGGLTITNSLTVSGGTFTNTSKTVTFDGGTTQDSTVTCSGSLGGAVDFEKSQGSGTANIVIASGCSVSLGANPTSTVLDATFTNNGTMVIDSGTWSITGTTNGNNVITNAGTITHNGSGWDFNSFSLVNNSGATITYSGTSLSITDSLTQSGTFNLSGKTITFDGSAVSDSTITCSGSLGGAVDFEKSQASGEADIVIASGCSVSLGANPTSSTLDAIITNNGTIVIDSGTWSITGTAAQSVINAGTIMHNGDGWDFDDFGLTNNSGATITYSGTTLNIEHNVSQNGTFDLSGKTLVFDGASSADDAILTCGSTISGNVTLNKTHVDGDLTLGGNCVVSGDFTITDGALILATGQILTVGGNWTDNTGTTLTAGTVVMNGSSKAINGSAATTFYNFTKSVTAADTLTFPTAVTTTISNNTTLNGTSGNLLSLRSSSSGTRAAVNISNTGTRTLQYLDVKDINNSNATAATCSPGCSSSGNNLNWTFPWGGIVYTDEGSTSIGSGKTVALSVNGGAATTGDTDSNGLFSIARTVSSGDVLAFYLDGETEQAALVTVVDGNERSNMHLYQDRLIIRNDNSGSTTNANLATADGNGDTDITDFYTASGSDVTVAATKELFIWGGSTYAPGGTVAATNLDVNGTFTMGTNAVSIAGTWDSADGTVTGTNTVTLSGSSQTITSSANTTFYNLTKTSASAVTLTFTTGVTTTISNNLTLEGASGNLISVRSSSNGTAFTIDVGSGTRSLKYLDVKDSTNSNATIAICTPGCLPQGNNTNWSFPITGTVYSDEGSTTVGAGVTVAMSVNGGAVTTGDTDANGQYQIPSGAVATNDVVTVFIDDEVIQGATVATVDTQAILGSFNVYQDRLIVRSEAVGGLTNANLATADGSGDTDITDIYSTDGSNNVTVTSAFELFVWTGETFTPGAQVTVHDIDINGTLAMGSNAVSVGGSWDATGGTFTGSNTVTFTSTTTETITSGGDSFNNLTVSGSAIHVNLQDALDVDGTLTIASGSTLDANSYGITNTGGTFANNGTLRLQGGETLTGFTNDTDTGTVYFDGTGTYGSLSGLTGFYNLTIGGAGSWTLAAAIDANNNVTISAGTLDTHASGNYGITVGGNWANSSGTFTARSGTVTFDGTSGTKTITETGSFHNVTLNDGGGSATFELGNAFDVNSNLTITGGTLDASSNSYAITVAGNWTNSDSFTARSGTVTLDGSNQTMAGSTTFNNLSKTVAAAATWTFTAGTTQTVTGTWTAQGASGQNLSLRSSSSGTQWRIDPQGTRTLAFIDIKDSNNTNASTVLCANDCVNSGNNSNWAFPLTVTVYTDEGTSVMGSGKTVAVSVNGGSKSTADTDSDSIATFTTVGTSPGDLLTIWLDDESENGVTVTITNATTLGFVIYQDRLVLQYEQGSEITSANLDTANNVSDSDIDAIYTTSGNNLTMRNNAELYIASGDTFTLGGTVTGYDIDINGTLAMGSNNVSLAGSWDATGGTFTGSNTVTFTASSAETIVSNGNSFNNIAFNLGTGGSVSNTDDLNVEGTQTISGASSESEEDTTDPLISSISATAAETQATILWTTDESADSSVNYGITSSLGTSASDSTDTIKHAVTITGLTANTTYHYQVSSADPSGNSSSSETNTFTTLQAGTTSDTTAPIISAISVSSVTSAAAVVSWTTNENTTTQLDYGESTSYNRGATSGSSNTLATAHEVTLTGLGPSTTYHYRVVAIDAAGNLTTGSDATFTTSSEEEEPEASEVFLEEETQTSEDAPELTTSDEITSAAPAVTEIGSTSVRVSWATTEKSTTVVYYRPLNSSDTPFKVGDPSFVTNHSVRLIGLKEATEYEYSVESADPEGNRLLSKRYQFTTRLPEVSEVDVTQVGAETAEFVYFTDSPTQSIIELTNLLTGETRVIELDEIVLEHRVPLSDLDPNTEYSAVILVKGPDGSLARSLAYIFSTVEDFETPIISAIEAKSALVEGQQDAVQTIISWTTNEPTTSQVQYNEGLTRENEYTSATEETTDHVTRHIVVLPDLQPSTVYQYRVRSVDEASNEAVSEARVLLTPQRRVSAFDIIIRNLEGAFGWARNIGR